MGGLSVLSRTPPTKARYLGRLGCYPIRKSDPRGVEVWMDDEGSRLMFNRQSSGGELGQRTVSRAFRRAPNQEFRACVSSSKFGRVMYATVYMHLVTQHVCSPAVGPFPAL